MSSHDFEDTKCANEQSNQSQQNSCPLLCLPLELREKIYDYIFAPIYARRWKHTSNLELAILGTCTQIHSEASSALYDRTPLRFIIGHRQARSSLLPPKLITDRFKNVSFELTRMSSTHPGYEFIPPFDEATKPYIQSPIRRNACHFQCELIEHAGSSCGPALLSQVRSFTGFETISLTFSGKIRKSKSPLLELVGEDSRSFDGGVAQAAKENVLSRELASLADLAKMFRKLEEYLGPGEMADVDENSESLHVRRIVFHPLRHVAKT